MKKLVCVGLILMCIVALAACKQDNGEDLDFGPACFTGEVMEIYEESFLVKIEDSSGCYFFDEEVIVRDVNAKENYAVGDHVKVQYGGAFLSYDPPQVGAESIVLLDADGNEMPPKEEPVMVGGDLIPSVYVNDAVYISPYYMTSYTEISKECVYLGEIAECVGSRNIPSENFQANYAPVGTEVYQYHSVILLLQNGVYCPYVREEEEPGFFDYSESLEVSLIDCHYVEGSDDWETTKTRVLLTEKETEELLDLLEPYAKTLTSDVLKTDYFRYYSIKIDDKMTLTIDPELGNYGENGDSYMLVMEDVPGAFIKGTYINADVINFLAERPIEAE